MEEVMAASTSSYSIQMVEKAFELLGILAETPENVSTQRLEEKLGLSRNRLFRLLATLQSRGLVEREELPGTYRLGLGSVATAQKILRNVSLIRHAHPVMENLARKHDEAVYLTVLDGDEVMFLDMVDSGQQIRPLPMVGERVPFFTNAAGKILRAVDSSDLLERRLRHKGTKKNVPDSETLVRELEAIRSRGVAVDAGGLGEGLISVAVAVKDYAGKVIGALTVLAPSFRMLTERLEQEIIPSLLEGAEILSFQYGYARV
jgi:DNA-binding IclR family transcriptional regulator